MSTTSLQEIRVWIDGQSASGEGARVSVFDRGFLYGDSVFETLRTYEGQVFALQEHLERLQESARRVLIPLPLTLSEWALEVESAVEQAGFAESYVRMMLTRGVGDWGLDPGGAQSPCRVLLVAPLQTPSAVVYEQGIRVICYETLRSVDVTLAAGAKVGNYLIAVLAMEKARAAGASEALIMDPDGWVLEGSTSNLFWVQEGVLHTPPVEAGILKGITREYILRTAERLQIQVRFQLPQRAELLQAQEVFISSSIREIVPVVAIDDQPVGGGRVGPLTQQLHAGFRQLVRESLSRV